MAKYPHLLPNEVAIWEKFLVLHGHLWEAFDYDVHVGQGIDPGPGYEHTYRVMYKTLTQRRIDAVGYREGEIWIFEVKPWGGSNALGQLLFYKELYEETFKPDKPIKLALVTDRIGEEEKKIYTKYGIEVFVVGPI